MKNQKVLVAALILAALGLLARLPAAAPESAYALSSAESVLLTNEDFLRFHVVANSNDPEDQWLKYQLRDHLLAYINLELARTLAQQADGTESPVFFTVEELEDILDSKREEIRREAERLLQSLGYSDPVTISLGLRWIPEKVYGETVFPAGTYRALTVTIGKGEGENWWCCLFPPLCLIGSPEAAAKLQDPAAADLTKLSPAELEALGLSSLTREELQMVSAYYTEILNLPKYKAAALRTGGRLQLRFKTLDWLRSR
ncbi:MAG: hypothetical protein E7223_00705 [Clostridiales bacterium]|nr:hypothetical protein [Clostridiales bacterium]